MANGERKTAAGVWAWADPANWPAAGRLTALGVVCALVLLYGRAQDANFRELLRLHAASDMEAFRAADRTRENHALLLRLESLIKDLGRRLDRLRGAPPDRPADAPQDSP